ncbi:cutinase family protein [Amycolatopsis nivea]|uniref:cutinase family protein n=1 Tax=Amycolatopsis nivea TaxID=1644109 RepID=UPI00106F3930|nr:cutinase family protein [Amycolatopsis nivea]
MRFARPASLFAALLASTGLPVLASPPAGAAACTDVDVVVARGTGEPGTLGVIVGGPVFAALRASLPGKSVSSYAVAYPASLQPDSASRGNQDLVDHVTSQAAACGNQRFVLVGYSQGANVVANSVGISSDGALVGGPIVATLPPEIAPRVAALLTFGPPIAKLGKHITGEYQDRTKEFCAAGDPICRPDGTNILAHLSYSLKAGEAAAFAAARINGGQ